MTKVDIFSGFLGAGKTTLIKKLIKEAYTGEKLVLIENEFGQVGIDGGFLKDAGIEITEMNSGCICCSLVGDFGKALKQVSERFSPDRILIEPSGVGKLSDVREAVLRADENLCVNGLATVVDASKWKIYKRNFGEFFLNQIETAGTVILSHVDKCDPDRLSECAEMIREENPNASLITTDWSELDGAKILSVIEHDGNVLAGDMEKLRAAVAASHDDDDDDECDHHDHGHEHEHHHEHGEGHHHADDVFDSIGIETTRKFGKRDIDSALAALGGGDYGYVLRAKGIVPGDDGTWIHFDFVPGEPDVRTGSADIGGRVCVIGTDLKSEEIERLFR